MRAVSLFTGIGGFDLAFERAGIETVLQVEKDPWCLKVLDRHWPEVMRATDVRDVGLRFDWRRGRGGTPEGVKPDAEAGHGARTPSFGSSGVDIVHGGFPCQPFSVAGKRAGTADERNLWPEFRRVVQELRPRWVVGENVPGLLSIDSGRFFGSILDDLAELGFEGVAYAVLDSRYFGVPQRRRRVFIVAGPTRRGVEQVLSLCESCGGHPAADGTQRQDLARGPDDGTQVASPLKQSSGERGWGLGAEDAPNLIAAPLDNDTYVVRTANTSSNGWGVLDDGTSHTLGGSADAVLAPTLDTHLGDKQWLEDQSVDKFDLMRQAGAGVRRLTPVECERLQGFPDDWTRYAADGTEMADSHRYRMLGNAVTVPTVEWIARRLIAVDGLLTPTDLPA